MIVWGVNALNHDASIAVFRDRDIVAHLRSAQDTELTQGMIDAALQWGQPQRVYWYENPWSKKLRQLRAGQFSDALDPAELPEIYLGQFGIDVPIISGDHHRSHAAAGYLSSPYDSALIVVADAIGQWDSLTVWSGQGTELQLLHRRRYPYSLGLFYSAFTQLLGYQPVAQENLVTQLSQQGQAQHYYSRVRSYLGRNLHRGIKDWGTVENHQDIAAAVQAVFLDELQDTIRQYQNITQATAAVFMGGCAYNRPARKLFEKYFKNTYTMYFPGDAGSSIGAVLAAEKIRISLPSIEEL